MIPRSEVDRRLKIILAWRVGVEFGLPSEDWGVKGDVSDVLENVLLHFDVVG